MRDKGEGKGGENAIHLRWEPVASGVGLHEFHVLPAMCGDAQPRLIEHGIGQIHPNDSPRLADRFLQQCEIQSNPTANIHAPGHHVSSPAS